MKLEETESRIQVRPVRFEVEAIEGRDPLWSRSCPEFSMYINALAIHSPYFERFLGAVVRRAREQIEDPGLRADIGRLIGQEGHHAHNFVSMNRFLMGRYPRVARLDEEARRYFERALERDSFPRQLGFVAGYETFTYLAGMMFFDDWERLMGDADPVARALWVWHTVEEVEHGTVAFDTYRAVLPGREWLRKWMLCVAFSRIMYETARALLHMIRVEGYGRRPRKAWRTLRFSLAFSARAVVRALPALRASYHPSHYPKSSPGRHPFADAWRARYRDPDDARTLQDGELARLAQEA